MLHILYWLLEMEKRAGNFYRAASQSRQFKNEKGLSKFLHHLAEDENKHGDIVERAFEYANRQKFDPFITVDADTIAMIEQPIIEAEIKLADGTISKEEIIDCIIRIEFSEWNYIFLYIINFLSKADPQCSNVNVQIQDHEKYIRRFIETNDELKKYRDEVKRLPLVHKDKVLLVEDDPLIINLFKAIFENKYEIAIAIRGETALDMLAQDYYDAIVSEITMPGISGLEMYEKTANIRPEIGERILFYSRQAAQYEQFFREHNLRGLAKPASVMDLEKNVESLIHRKIDEKLGSI